MEITPQEVQQKQFETTKKGFDPQQVGMFLDQIAAALAARDRELHEARTEIEALSKAVVDVKQNEEAFRLTMSAATEAKEEMLRRAEEHAASIEQEARKAAELLIERARIDAGDAVGSMNREIESLYAEKARLQTQLSEVRGAAAAATGAGAAQSDDEPVAGRPSLELVVDRPQNEVASDPSELAARVGELRG